LMMRRAVVTAYGLITPLGNRKEVVWRKLIEKQSALRSWDDLEKEGFRFSKACRVEGEISIPHYERGTGFARQALEQALADYPEKLPEDTAVIMGSTIGESGAFEAIATGVDLDPANFTIDTIARKIKKEYGLKGLSHSYGTACAAGNYALGTAASFIQKGLADVVIAGGVEPFSRVAMTGFSRSRAMTADHCRPFDRDRDGMVLGEGAAVFILEDEVRVKKRGAEPLAIIGSLGLSCDAYHATAPLPDGSGITRAIENALFLEKIEPRDVHWICAHGSGTEVSDRAEATAISRLFGKRVPVSGTKGALGHALGAATAIEAAICLMALEHQLIPPTVNLEYPDPEFEIDLVTQARRTEMDYVMNCGYAFGGLNSALLMKKWK
jgi:3-oxoacyl-[acyl-carrier-protein] synthase II